jgi:hypothetical protein
MRTHPHEAEHDDVRRKGRNRTRDIFSAQRSEKVKKNYLLNRYCDRPRPVRGQPDIGNGMNDGYGYESRRKMFC